ncbi:MAG: protein-L-isoaspartate O-methyltransferase [Omnitrophica bacterium RIFCSPHIGHO2_02_FULL_63_14]|nr:MAG: protein-L-isoaspartate O-methyltransferase [Omnitrophica bacterium RIFCSPHIGHO2_02_FULL_63_14]
MGAAVTEHDPFRDARARMVAQQVAARGVRDPRVLAALRAVPRHVFVPEPLRPAAYDDSPLPIGESQTISQPYIVALMSELAEVRPGDRLLEIGTGSGYQAAVLAELTPPDHVYTIEILPALAARARQTFDALGYRAIQTKVGDGYAGWPEQAPFDAILVTAAPDHVPQPLMDQLAVGGRLVVPVGPEGVTQTLRVLTKQHDGTLATRDVLPVSFVPLVRGDQPR